MSMGKGLGGGSSINVMVWARGHRSDWDFFAAEAGDPAWGYEPVLDIYRRIENWQGSPDPHYRGKSGPVWVQPASEPSPIALAMLDAAEEIGIPRFDHPNGAMMEGAGGAASDRHARAGRQAQLAFSRLSPSLDGPPQSDGADRNDGPPRHCSKAGEPSASRSLAAARISTIRAGSEVVLSLGAMHTPKVLMHSGIGDQSELDRFGIPVVQHLPGVGRNLQDHVAFCCIWEYREPIAPRNSGSEATLYWKTRRGARRA